MRSEDVKKELFFGLLLFFAVAFALWLVFPSKIECSYDGPSHVQQTWFYKYSLQNYMKVPWTNPFVWDGSMFLVFRAPLFYIISGLISFLVGQIAATKLLLFLSYVLAVYAMYLLGIEYRLGKNGSVMAGLLFAFSGWHLFSTFFRAAYLDSFGYALLPLPFLYAKRGLTKSRHNLAFFLISSALLALSHQVSLLYVLPAIAVYVLAIEGKNVLKKKEFAISALWLLLILLFFAVPLLEMNGEGGHDAPVTSALVFDGGPTFPLNFVIPQWGIRYFEVYSKFWFMPVRGASNNSYVGILHMALFALGLLSAKNWKKYPGMSSIVILSLGFFLGVIPGIYPHMVERVLFIFALPVSIFAVMGIETLLKPTEQWKRSALLAFSLFVNIAGLYLLLNVYSVKGGFSLPLALPIVFGLAALAFPALLYRKIMEKPQLALLAILMVLFIEVAPNAINPTMVFPTATQVDPCAYQTKEHEYLVNPRGVLCSVSCEKAYLFQNGLFDLASKNIYMYWRSIMPDTSKCPPQLSNLGIKYCFQPGNITEFEPAPFINSTSEYAIEKNEPDNLAIRFDEAGATKVRRGYFSFYRAFSAGGELKLKESPEGFIEFDHPAGVVELKVMPPRSFMYSYLVSAIAGLALLASGVWCGNKNTKMEWLLLLGLTMLLAHILIRLFWMVIA